MMVAAFDARSLVIGGSGITKSLCFFQQNINF